MKHVTIVKWTIEKFKTVAPSNGSMATIISEDFILNGTTALAYLVFCPINPFDKKRCSLFMQVKVVDKDAIGGTAVNVRISNKEGKIIVELKGPIRKGFLKEYDYTGFSRLALKSVIYSSVQFIKDGAIVIQCEIIYDDGDKDSTTPIDMPRDKLFLNTIIQGVIILSGQKVVCVAKKHLVSTSDVFKHLLKFGTKNEKKGRIKLTKLDHIIFSEFKHFVFTGRLSANWSRNAVEQLYELAEGYLLKQIKIECKQYLLTVLKLDELMIALKLGFVYGDEELKRYALYNLSKNFKLRTEIAYFESNEWIDFAAGNLKRALNIKIAAYKAVGILPEDYQRIEGRT